MKLKITGIYRITNIITHMSYIGQSENIWARWGSEELASHCTSDPFYNSLLCQAIREYGVNNFECEILEECSAQDLNQKEQYYIELYKTMAPYGYNKIKGGGVYTNLQCTMYDIDGNKIRDFTDNKTIIDYLFTHNAVKQSYRYEIIKNIRLACEGKRQIVWGYRWSYINQPIVLSQKSSKKIVYELDDNNNIINQWFSCGDAARAIGCTTSTLARHCRERSKSCMNRHFCYASDYQRSQ